MKKETIRLKDWFWGPAKSPLVEFFRSMVVGGIAFAVDAGLMVLLKEVAGLGAVWASTIAFLFGLTVNYLLSVFWVFKQSNVKNATTRFLIFAAIATVGLLMNDAIIWLFDGPLARSGFISFIPPQYYYMVGKVVATVIVFFWNFISRKLFLFRSEKPARAE